ncbi:MAG: hypothetical protein IJZ59_06750 [Alphaproteobacteria bacterium]|nr:hypothetical protein [Alphaproteobacteria bacterium]
MSSKHLKILFVLLIFTASLLVGIKTFVIIADLYHKNPNVAADSCLMQNYDELNQISNELEARRLELETKTDVLNALSAEIDDKLEMLQQAENNLLHLIQTHNNSLQNDVSVTTDAETETVIIEIGNTDE